MIEHVVDKMATQESSAAFEPHVTPAIFDRIVVPLSQRKVLIPLAIVLFVTPVITALIDGIFGQFHQLWRVIYIQPTIIVYILLLTPFHQRANRDVIVGLRPIIKLTDEEYNDMVVEKSRINPRGEYIALAIGLLIGFLMNMGASMGVQAPLTYTYKLITTIIMYTSIIWALYVAVASARLNKEIYRLPIEVNIFDLRPFEPIGRESLVLSFSFIVGATIAMAFSITAELVLTVENIVIYLIFAGMTIVVFYANMIDTYRLLLATKKRDIHMAQDHISEAYHSFKHFAEEGKDIRTSVTDVNAWIVMKERLGKTQTWPHSTATVGRLLATAFMPAAVAGLRQVAQSILERLTLPF